MASALSTVADGAWSAEDTTPAEIEAVLGELAAVSSAEAGRHAPARVLNLVVVVDAVRRGEALERLERVGRFHPSRTIVCVVREGREGLGAYATMACEMPPEPGGLALCRERLELEMGPASVPALASIVDPLLVPDLETLAWSPYGRSEALDALRGIADSVLLDSSDAGAGAAGGSTGSLPQALALSARTYVVDLAWLRGAPWRERLAALLDPPEWRPALAGLSGLEVRHHPGSASSAALLAGWLASRLAWAAEPLAVEGSGARTGSASSAGGPVAISLHPDPTTPVPGLSALSLEARSGLALSLDRGAGGLSAWRRTPDGEEARWTVLGASRGESGVLGEGIRQALLRSSLYGAALERAVRMVE